MIRAVFFDWFNTLAHYQPSREELQSRTLEEFGIHLSPQEIVPALFVADRGYFEENTVSPVRKRSPEEQAEVYIRYQKTVLTEAGVDVSGEPDIFMKIMKRAQELSRGMSFALFDDVLPTLEELKVQGFTSGLLTNMDGDVESICRGLGLEPYLDFIVSSGEVGVDKPDPLIFMTALEKAGVDAAAAAHVGDQYNVDITGARGVGITPVLLDRNGLYPEVSDCPRIGSLTGLIDCLR